MKTTITLSYLTEANGKFGNNGTCKRREFRQVDLVELPPSSQEKESLY